LAIPQAEQRKVADFTAGGGRETSFCWGFIKR